MPSEEILERGAVLHLATEVKARVMGPQQTYKLKFLTPGVKMKWAKSDEFSDFHTPKIGVKCPHKGAAGAF